MADVLIFDDDPDVGGVVSAILRERGLTVSHFLSGAGAIQLVQENKPRLVVLDVMMPGMDGLTACRTLKSTPATKAVKIVVLTAKDFGHDRETALRYGADLYFNKPFETDFFLDSIGKILALPQVESGAAPPAPPLVFTSLPGGVAVEAPGFWVLFDAGRGLGAWLETRRTFPQTCWVLLSRYEPAATAELAAASRIAAAGARINLAGPDESESLLQRSAYPLCATRADGSRATPMLYPQREGEFSLAPGIRVLTRYTQHPGTCLAYRLEIQNRAIVYCPAHEVAPNLGSWNPHEYEKFRSFFAGADVLVHGYRRSINAPAPQDALGRGAWEPVVDIAAAARAKFLLLTQVAPDSPVEGLQPLVDQRVQATSTGLRAIVSRPPGSLVL